VNRRSAALSIAAAPIALSTRALAEDTVRLRAEVQPTQFALDGQFSITATFAFPPGRRFFLPLFWGPYGLILWVWDADGARTAPPAFPPYSPHPPGMFDDEENYSSPDLRTISDACTLNAADCFPKRGRYSLSLQYHGFPRAILAAVPGAVAGGDVPESPRIPVTVL
jgi:hypothetical protein